MEDIELYKKLVRNAEERYIWYKKEVENVYKDKVSFPPDEELVIWYKQHLREMKTVEEGWMKENIKTLNYLKEGLDYPFLYKH
jgi:hypothetical protein